VFRLDVRPELGLWGASTIVLVAWRSSAAVCPCPLGTPGSMTFAAPARLAAVPRRTGPCRPVTGAAATPHGVRRHRPACGHVRADFTSPCTCWSAGEYTWDIPLSARWTCSRMGRAARCPPGGGSPSSGTTLAPFNARGSLGLTLCCGRVPVDSVVAGAANCQGLAPHLCRLRCPGGLSGRGRGGTRRLSPSSSTR
jgi:hypothetical protein